MATITRIFLEIARSSINLNMVECSIYICIAVGYTNNFANFKLKTRTTALSDHQRGAVSSDIWNYYK